MPNRIILASIAVVVGVTTVAAIAGAWSMSHKTAGRTEATKASAPASSHDTVVKRGNSLPVEYWSDPF